VFEKICIRSEVTIHCEVVVHITQHGLRLKLVYQF